MVLGAEPVRTCVGCRRRAPASTLLRVVAVVDAGTQRLAVDPRHRLPGRGAYLHVDPACLATADKRRAFMRALRVVGVLETDELAAYVAAAGGDRENDGGVEMDVRLGKPSPDAPGPQGRTTQP